MKLFLRGILLISFLSPFQSYAAVFCVDDLADGPPSAVDCAAACDGSDDCSLRDAVQAANITGGSDEIIFDVTGTYIYDQPDEIAITEDLTITGPGADQLTVDAGNQPAKLRVIGISTGGGTVTISGLTITGGNPALDGGGIQVDAGDTLNLSSCIVSENSTTGNGGGIISAGTLNVTDSTISGNSATNVAGGIASLDTTTIMNSSITDNTDELGGGGRISGGRKNAHYHK